MAHAVEGGGLAGQVGLVFETDLTQLWTLPRRQRYGPLLAGLAVDSVLLAALLTGRLLIDTGVWAAPGLVASLLAAWAFIKIMQMLWQSLVFLRTDLYAVLVNALGCRNLWRVKTLMLRRAFGRLTEEEAAEPADATDTDLRVGRWFRWVWLAGFASVVAWFCLLLLPVFAEVLRWPRRWRSPWPSRSTSRASPPGADQASAMATTTGVR
ncbi:hypothetical protein ACI2LC_08140 [Nonomuraea wenchangensis]|uniref:hypothetical protein n=1 Tax=Nonomuraea wenchangensis TaxID=568860 RepID=UPI00384A7E1C